MLKCQMCQHVFSSIHSFNNHHILHKNMPNLRIICAYKNYKKQFSRYPNFKKHIYRCHKIYNNILKYYCKENNCNTYFTSRENFNKHLYCHIRESKIGIYCGYPTCSVTTIFKTVSTYAVHICRYHSKHNSFKQHTNNSYIDNDNPIINNSHVESHLNENSESNFPVNKTCDDTINYGNILSKLYFVLSTKYFLTEHALQTITNAMSSISEFSQQNFITILNNSDLPYDIKIKV